MSIFRALTGGDFDDDPAVALQRFAMGSMFPDPFGMMGPPALAGPRQQPRGPFHDMQMMPFGFPSFGFPMPPMNPNMMLSNFGMQGNGNCHSFASTSVMTMTNGPDGRPQVYQESTSTRVAPGGVKETKKTVCDSRTGTKQMAIGHHIGERAHILERKQDLRSGEEEENQEFINLEEEEAETFNKEWENRTRRSMGAIGGPSGSSHRRRPEQRHLALPSPSSRPEDQTNKKSSPSTSPAGRKREHTPEAEVSHKRHVAQNSDD
ncbi:myeloid leukemia factor isoform X3 [Belonocnema kinseyi]|uniref:myeloid leukemia factor isoform X3 n=1 Tax=Belonocnema kinseyi TaxID=2817044 RepID=UPI00143DB1E5|nr:myeloid leukemia factor isoform X3 [Belonocnema kinseyi]